MKQITSYCAVVLLFSQFLISCNSAKTVSGEVNYLATPEPGTVMVSAAGYGPSKSAAMQNAESNAFNSLIFRGIPGSQQQLPMIANEAAARKTHGAYLEKLLGGGYKAFMLLSTPQSDYAAARNGRKNLTQQVKINVDALRRDMEQHGVVRKFGL